MLEELRPKDMISAGVRVVGDRVTLLGIIVFILGLASQDPVSNLLFGRVKLRGALGSIDQNLMALLNSGFVRLFLVGYGLFLLARASRRVVMADDARAVTKRQHEDDVAAAHQAALSVVSTHLDDLLARASATPSLIARLKLQREQLDRVDEVIVRAQNTIHAYREALRQVREGAGWKGANVLTMVLDSPLRSAQAVLHEAAHTLGTEIEPPKLEDPTPILTPVQGSDSPLPRFQLTENSAFVDAHENNIKKLQERLDDLLQVAGSRHAEYRQAEEQLDAHLAQFAGS